MVMKSIFLLLLTFVNMLNNMDYTIIYFLPITGTEPCTRAKSEQIGVSLVLSRLKF